MNFYYKMIKIDKKSILLSLIISLFIVLSQLIRNIFISGTLIYPISLLNLYLPWSPSKQSIINISSQITGWARNPGKNFMKSLNQDLFEWFPIWYQKNIGNVEVPLFFILFILFIFNINKFKYLSSKQMLLYFSVFISIIFSFFNAPDLRFMGIFFWILIALNLIIVLHEKIVTKSSFYILFILTIIYIRLDHLIIDSIVRYDSIRFDFVKITDLKSLPVIERTFNDKIIIYKPIGYECGNSSLPCTTLPIEEIHLININDFKDGFKP